MHDEIVKIYGSAGFPHPGYLDSALSAAKNFFYYNEDGGFDLFDLAAVYLYHVAKAHAFTDGNKRTAYATALVFLAINGLNLLLPENVGVLAEATIKATEDLLDKPGLAATMRTMPRENQLPIIQAPT